MMSKSNWWCSEYCEEIHEILRQREDDRLYSQHKAPQLEWRAHILRYMIEVAEEYKLASETLHLAVYFMDIFIDNHIIRLWRLELVALTSLRVATKIEEKNFPSHVLNSYSDTKYEKEDFNILEIMMLKMLDWDVTVPTVRTFGTYYIESAVNETDFNNSSEVYDSFDDFKEDVKSDIMELMDQSLFDLSLQYDYCQSELAAMCIAAVRYRKRLQPYWPTRLQKLTRYEWHHISYNFKKLFHIKVIPRDQLLNELDLCAQSDMDR